MKQMLLFLMLVGFLCGCQRAEQCVEGAESSPNVDLATGFADVPVSARPWCYWWWINGHVDKETITADLEAMKELGFGGLLMFDSRGYWDDERHVVLPKAEIEFMSEEWQGHVVHAIREAARLGLEFTMNVSSSGGKLDGPWLVGEDAPKQLMASTVALEAGKKFRTKLEKPNLENYHDVATFVLNYEGDEISPRSWFVAGDGSYTMEAASGKRKDNGGDNQIRKAVKVIDATDKISKSGEFEFDVPAQGKWCLIRFGWQTIPGHHKDVDVLDPKAVAGHFNRITKPLKSKIGDLMGKTLTHFYSVSWEGAVPTWSKQFEADFKKYKGYEIRPFLPMLAGFDIDGKFAKFMTDYRKARNDMFRDNFYGTMRDLAKKLGVKWFSESGGPWVRKAAVFQEADQQEYLAVNDLPQGEFWYQGMTKDGGAKSARTHVRGAVATAHTYGLKRASAEAFTHMTYHWSAYPAVLKRAGDEVFADGINHFVWHTFTCSPKKFGIPGSEYFAGTHINRNVTWHKQAKHFIQYLGRCQWMLQQGMPVADYAIWAGDRVYQHWGRYRDKPYDSSKYKLPEGRAYDLMNTDVLLNRVLVKDGKIVLPGGMTYSSLVIHPEFPESLTMEVQKKIDELKSAGVPILYPPEVVSIPRHPDFVTSDKSWTYAHRKTNNGDIYFVIGSGKSTVTFRAQGASVELWDAVTGKRTLVEAKQTDDGRTTMDLFLPKNGSVFVVFSNKSDANVKLPPKCMGAISLGSEWDVSFKNAGMAKCEPKPIKITKFEDWSKNPDKDIKHFAGTVTYSKKVTLTEEQAKAELLSLGEVKGGVAEVLVNGKSCGVAWTYPWEVSVAGYLKRGENEIQIRFTNTWANRLIGDCFLPEEERVTVSGIRYHKRAREGKTFWQLSPTIFSGYTQHDELFANGVLGPVVIKVVVDK